MSSNGSVFWHEGMFLRPHHFLVEDRNASELLFRGIRNNLAHYWGIRSIDLDLDALENYRFVVRSLRARLREGTSINVPEDGVLPVVDLKGPLAMSGNQGVTIHLAIPVFYPGRANVQNGDASGDAIRYRVETRMMEDENTGAKPRPIRVRRLNLTLLPSTQDLSGYDQIPIARVFRSARTEATPQLDEGFIPPLLACDSWSPLSFGILQGLHDRIGKRIEVLATQTVSRRLGFDSRTQGSLLVLEQLRDLNELYSYLGILAYTQGIHPLLAYLELARFVGRLSVFDTETRRPPSLPRYDHDDLGTCFYQVKHRIDALLDMIVEPDYKERHFVGVGLRMQVALEPAWLEATWSIYIGVQSELEAEDCVRLLTRPGELDMKIGSGDRVDIIYQMGLAGLKFDRAPQPPRELPTGQGLTYFQVARDAEQEEWYHVQRSLTLALRLNENVIAGDIQNKRTLMIRSNEGQVTTMEFTLYVIRLSQ